MDKRIKVVTYKPIKAPFSGEGVKRQRTESKAYREVFSKGTGAKILDQLIIDMNYFEPQFPADPQTMGFELGKKYVVNHILRAMNAEYTTREELVSNINLMENDDDE